MEERRLSIKSLLSNDENDLLAAEVLSNLNSTVTTNTRSNSTTPPNEQLTHPLITKIDQISNHPIITNAVKYYEHSKSYLPILNYGAEIVERATKPMVKKWENDLNDRYRQKRKLSELTNSNNSTDESAPNKINLPSISEALSKNLIQENLQQFNKSYTEFNLNMSIETKKRIQFCLHLLKLANVQLNSKVNNLQTLVVKRQQDKKIVKKLAKSTTNTSETVKNETKKEIITTVKKIISMVSKLQVNTLSEPAKGKIRENLLKLPINWTNKVQSIPGTPVLEQGNPMDQITPSDSNAEIDNSEVNGDEEGAGVNNDDKVLILANESLEMISNLINVFTDQLDKAEDWVKTRKMQEVYKKRKLLETDHPTGETEEPIDTPEKEQDRTNDTKDIIIEEQEKEATQTAEEVTVKIEPSAEKNASSTDSELSSGSTPVAE